MGSRRTSLSCAPGAAALVVAGCGSGSAGPNQADRTFLQDMTPHHERALAVARIGITQGDDPRVRAFARRIVGEQPPELARGIAGAPTSEIPELRRLLNALS